jgi:hypothetical protein
MLLGSSGNRVAARPVRSIPLCSGVTLSASYLALVGSDQRSGFRFVLTNRTGRAIKLAAPVPSSSHWYARSHGRWLWRASNGAGGSLVDAGNPHGRVAVYPAADMGYTGPAPDPGMDRKPSREPGSRVQTWLPPVFLSRRERVPGGVCLRLSCPWRSATGAVALWIALGSGPYAAEKLNSLGSLYVNFS